MAKILFQHPPSPARRHSHPYCLRQKYMYIDSFRICMFDLVICDTRMYYMWWKDNKWYFNKTCNTPIVVPLAAISNNSPIVMRTIQLSLGHLITRTLVFWLCFIVTICILTIKNIIVYKLVQYDTVINILLKFSGISFGNLLYRFTTYHAISRSFSAK